MVEQFASDLLQDLFDNLDKEGYAYGWGVGPDFGIIMFWEGDGMSIKTIPDMPDVAKGIDDSLIAYTPYLFRMMEAGIPAVPVDKKAEVIDMITQKVEERTSNAE